MCGGRAGLPPLIPHPSFCPSIIFTHGLSSGASGFPVILFTHCHLLCLLFPPLYFHINLCCICSYIKSIFVVFWWLRLQKLPLPSCCGIPTSFLSKKIMCWRRQLGHVLNLHPKCSYSWRLSSHQGQRQVWWPLHQLVIVFCSSICFPGRNRCLPRYHGEKGARGGHLPGHLQLGKPDCSPERLSDYITVTAGMEQELKCSF